LAGEKDVIGGKEEEKTGDLKSLEDQVS